jgi:hypothetical protein
METLTEYLERIGKDSLGESIKFAMGNPEITRSRLRRCREQQRDYDTKLRKD